MRATDRSGFTLAELVLTVFISAAVLGIAYAFLRGSMDQMRAGEDYVDVQQNLRVAGEMLAEEIRMAGYGIDYGNGQQGLVYAGPWDIVFNANVNPEPDVFGDPRVPVAMDPSASPAYVGGGGATLYSPGAAFGTGAETIRYSLDSDGDGTITSNDRGDDDEEDAGGPRDYVLGRYVYGSDSTGSNGGAREKVAVCAGPSDDTDDPTTPLFQYLYDDDNDPQTALRLWGDSNGDMSLDASEIAAVTPVSVASLAQVKRVRVNLTGDAGRLGSGASTVNASEGASSSFRTELGLRNKPRTLGIIRGTVFADENADGTRQGGELAISGAQIRLSTGSRSVTGTAGEYSFEVDPGTYSVTEFDPAGYVSTTPNVVSATLTPGGLVTVDFGDRSAAGNGWIRGAVWNDANGDTLVNPGEWGIKNVVVYLNTGARDTTDVYGEYSFYLPVSSYTVTEIDSAGYLSTTPNQVNVTLAAAGDTVSARFGDRLGGQVGTLQGVVFNDLDEDGMQGVGESGLAQVLLFLDTGDTTLTDSQGQYAFSLEAGIYAITQVDLESYVSTTPNNVTGVLVVGDSTTIVNFGDRPEQELNFDEIVLSNTDRALSVRTGDLKEDTKGEPEIVLGTRYASGVNNILVYFNNWLNSNTPNASIFSSTPSYTRSGGADVTAIGMGTLGSDAVLDVASGLYATSSNLKIWQTQTSGPNKGVLPTSPNNTYSTGLAAEVLSMAVADMRGTTALDLVIGTRLASGQGRIEIWTGTGSGTFSLGPTDIYTTNAVGLPLGEPYAIATAQLDGSGGRDIAVATRTSEYAGRIDLFYQNGSSGNFVASRSYVASGRVNGISAVDMQEDATGDLDLVIGTSTAPAVGQIELWLNAGSGNFGKFRMVDGVWVKSDSVAAPGEALAIGVTPLDADVYPDVAAGLKTGLAYQGALVVYRTFGFLPNSGTAWSGSEIGEVVTLDTNDFNKDGRQDVVVGTRTGASSGKLVVYFQQ